MNLSVALLAAVLTHGTGNPPSQCASQVGQQITTRTFDEVRAGLPNIAPKGPYESTAEYESRLAAAQSGGVSPVNIRRGNSRPGLSYNADRQELTVYEQAFGAGELNYADVLGRPRVGSLEDYYSGAIGFVIDEIETGRRTFEATNGFGARTLVESIEGRINAVWERAGRLTESPFQGMRLAGTSSTLRVGPAEARDIIENGATALMVVPRPPYIRTGTSMREATFAFPREHINAVTILMADIQCAFLVDGHGRVVLALPVR